MRYSAQTQVIRLNPDAPDKKIIERAAAIIQRGGLVAFPTETVYGLGANALDANAVAHIFSAKSRPASDPVIVHIYDWQQIEAVALHVPAAASTLAAAFWPGPLTLVLHRHPTMPANISAGRGTIAVRMPAHPVALALLKAAHVPIAAPSANLFSRPSATSAQHVLEDLNGHVDMILDAGPTRIGVESTVLDLTTPVPVVLRPGGITLESLRALIPNVQLEEKHLKPDDEAGASPGMLIKHYSPRAEMLVFSGAPDAVLSEIRARTQSYANQGRRAGILVSDEAAACLGDVPAQVCPLGRTLEEISHNLFEKMRQLDAAGVEIILAQAPERAGLGTAIWDRLMRAAEGNVIEVDA